MTKILVTVKVLDSGEMLKEAFEGLDEFDCYKKAEKWAKDNKYDIFFFEVLKEPK